MSLNGANTTTTEDVGGGVDPSGKLAVVTRASGGIGLETACTLAAAGSATSAVATRTSGMG